MSREIERFDYGQVSPATGLADSAAAVNYVLEHESLAYLMGVGNDLSGPVSPTDIPVNLVIENTFLPAFDVPKFVPRVVGDMMTAAWLAILSQRYSGSVYADLLTEVELMATVAARVDELQVAMFDKQLIFMASVEKMRGAAVFEETQRKFGEFALHSAVYGRNAARGQVFNSVPELVRRKCSITVVAGNYGVLRYGGSCDAEDIPVMLPVVTDALHRALLRIPAKHVGKTMHVSVRRRADGLYYFTDVYDEACSYPVDALPEGEAVLEGMYGAPVRTSLLSSLLISVRVLPVLKHVHGYCYLGCVPHRTRWQASQVLGMSPSRADIERVAPDVHDWCVVEAGFEEVKTIACGPSGTRVRVLHITSDGSMPSRVGRDDVLAGDADSDRRYAQAELNSLFEGVRAKASRAPPAAAGAKVPAGLGPGLVPFPNARVRPRGDSVSARSVDSDVSAGTKISGSPLVIGRKRTAYTSTLDVPRAVQGLDLGDEECFNIAWDDVPDGLVRAWAARLAEGAPVGPADLMRLARLTPDSLPDPPHPRGTAVAMATDHEPPDMADFPAWKQRTFPIPGWAMESVDVRVKLKKGQRKCLALVPPISGTFCRYEFAFDRDVNVSQSVGVVGSKSVLWLKGAATVDVDSEGTIVRLWCSSGVPALGVLSTSMMVGFSCAAIHSYSSNVTMDSVVTLRLVKSAGGQGMLKYAAEVSAASLVGEVYLHIGDDIPGEPVCFVAEADGLRSVTVAGVKVPAKKGVRASVVVQRARFSVRFSFVAGCAAKVVLSMVVIDRVGKFLDEVGKFASRGLLARSRGIERLALTGG